MTQKQVKKLHFRYSESGALLFTKAQTKKRFALCREALTNNKSYSLRIKNIYESQEDIERNAMKEFIVESLFTDRYFQLHQRSWGGLYFNYEEFAAVEGAFFPFVRTKFRKHQAIDEGCIWIGSKSEFPLIYVHNSIAKWTSPISKSGFVRTEPFLPVSEARKILPRLMNRVIYPDLDVSFL